MGTPKKKKYLVWLKKFFETLTIFRPHETVHGYTKKLAPACILPCEKSLTSVVCSNFDVKAKTVRMKGSFTCACSGHSLQNSSSRGVTGNRIKCK